MRFISISFEDWSMSWRPRFLGFVVFRSRLNFLQKPVEDGLRFGSKRPPGRGNTSPQIIATADLEGGSQSNHLGAVCESRQVFSLCVPAANLDTFAGSDILESRLCHPHVSAKGDLEDRSLGNFNLIEVGLSILYEQRTIFLVNLDHGPGDIEILFRALILWRSNRERAEKGEGRDNRSESCHRFHYQLLSSGYPL
jgi:hypothetical protein